MIGLDTSVLIRYLVHRPSDQARRAAAVIEADMEVGVSVVVILEAGHVLRTQYGIARRDVIDTLIEVLTRENVILLGLAKDVALEALVRARSLPQAPFGDALIAAMAGASGAVPLYSFDRRMGQHGIAVARP